MKKLTRIAIVALSVSALSVAAQAVELKLDLSEGDAYVQKIAQESASTQTMAGQVMTTKNNVELTMLFRVLEIMEDRAAKMQLTYTRIQAQSESPQGSSIYDSEDPPETMNAEMKRYAAMLNNEIGFTLSPKGEIGNLEGVEAMIDAMVDAMDVEDGANEEQLREQIKTQFGDGMVKQLLEQGFGFYPEQAVEAGDSWTTAQHVNPGFPITLETTYTLKEVKDGKAYLDAEGSIKTDADGAPLNVGGGQMKHNLEGTHEGSMVVGLEDGMMDSAMLKQAASGTIHFSSGGQSMEIPTTLNTAVEIEQEETGETE